MKTSRHSGAAVILLGLTATVLAGCATPAAPATDVAVPAGSVQTETVPAPNTVLDNITAAEELYLSCGLTRIIERTEEGWQETPEQAIQFDVTSWREHEASGEPEIGIPERRIPRAVIIQLLTGALETLATGRDLTLDDGGEIPVSAGGRELGSVLVTKTRDGRYSVDEYTIAPIGTMPCDPSKLPDDFD